MPAVRLDGDNLESTPFLVPTATLHHEGRGPIPQTITISITTGFAAPTAVASPATSSSAIPVAAIAGGSVAGALLAIIAVVGWKWWGRSIDRDVEKYRKKQRELHQVRENTRRNSESLHHPRSRASSVSHQNSAKKVKFLAPSSSEDNSSVDEKPRVRPILVPSAPQPLRPAPGSKRVLSRPRNRTLSASSQPHLPLVPHPLSISTERSPSSPSLLIPPSPTSSTSKYVEHLPAPSPPPPLPPLTSPTVLPRSPKPSKEEVAEPLIPAPLHSLHHQPSVVSSESFYSMQSGEEHTTRVPRSLIAAALGESQQRFSMLTKSSASVYSTPDARSSWRFLAPIVGRGGGGARMSRLSAGSSAASAIARHTRPLDAPGRPIGFAYSGEDEVVDEEDSDHEPTDEY